MSHAEWPKESHEHGTTQFGEIIYCPPKTMDIGYHTPRFERLSKCETKLRAVSCAGSGGSALREYRRGGKLLPTRRALFQSNVLEPGSEIEEFSTPGSHPAAYFSIRWVVFRRHHANDIALRGSSVGTSGPPGLSPSFLGRTSQPRSQAAAGDRRPRRLLCSAPTQ